MPLGTEKLTSLVCVSGGSTTPDESAGGGSTLPSLAVGLALPSLGGAALPSGALSTGPPFDGTLEPDDGSGTVGGPCSGLGWLALGSVEEGGTGTVVLAEALALDAMGGAPLAAGTSVPSADWDLDEQPAMTHRPATHGPATENSNTDGRDDFIGFQGGAGAALPAVTP